MNLVDIAHSDDLPQTVEMTPEEAPALKPLMLLDKLYAGISGLESLSGELPPFGAQVFLEEIKKMESFARSQLKQIERLANNIENDPSHRRYKIHTQNISSIILGFVKKVLYPALSGIPLKLSLPQIHFFHASFQNSLMDFCVNMGVDRNELPDPLSEEI